MEEVTSVNAGQESVEGSQQEQVQQEGAKAPEAAAPVQETPVQSADVNAQFASVRRETEQKTRDQVISEMYGQSHGIHTYADYQAALQAQREAEQRQQMIDNGINPELINNLIEQHPDIKFARELKAKQETQEAWGREVDAFDKEFPGVQAKDIPLEVFQLREREGVPLLYAYKSVMFGQVRSQAEQDVIQRLNSNAASSPGSLGQPGEAIKKGVGQMSKAEFDKLQEGVLRGEIKNL